jgi:hypothetical protein
MEFQVAWRHVKRAGSLTCTVSQQAEWDSSLSKWGYFPQTLFYFDPWVERGNIFLTSINGEVETGLSE